VAHNDTLGLWLVSSHADVVAVSRDPGTFCSSRGIMTFEIGISYATPPTMMHADPADHTRYRDLVQPGFCPSYMRALEDGIRQRVRALVDRIEPGVSVDVVAAVAVPAPPPGDQ
jgi:cytochrome P450